MAVRGAIGSSIVVGLTLSFAQHSKKPTMPDLGDKSKGRDTSCWDGCSKSEMTKTYIRMVQIHDTGKTLVWAVETLEDGAKIGEIRWFGRWRKYAFWPNDAIFEQVCLREIADFIEAQTKEHFERKRKRRSAPKVSKASMAALIQWRERNIEQTGHEALMKILFTLQTYFGPGQPLEQSVPQEHQAAIAAFHALDEEAQYELVGRVLLGDAGFNEHRERVDQTLKELSGDFGCVPRCT